MKQDSQLKKSILFSIFLLTFYFGGSYILSLIFKHYSISPTEVEGILISQLGLVLIPVIIYFLITRNSLVKTLKLYPINLMCLMKIILFTICIQPLVMTVSAIGNLFFANHTTSVMLGLTNTLSYPAMLLLTAVLPAIIEEISLRGIILSGFKGRPTFPSAVINGIIFAVLHGNVQQGLYAFVLGFIFVYLVNASGSIAASMIAHFIINASSVTLVYALSDVYRGLGSSSGSSQVTLSLASQEALLAIGVLAILSIGFTFLAYLLYRSIKNQGKTFFKDRGNTITI